MRILSEGGSEGRERRISRSTGSRPPSCATWTTSRAERALSASALSTRPAVRAAHVATRAAEV